VASRTSPGARGQVGQCREWVGIAAFAGPGNALLLYGYLDVYSSISKRLGMSQQQFADTLGIPAAPLQNWEQNRVMMEPARIALMRIMAHKAKAALRRLTTGRGASGYSEWLTNFPTRCFRRVCRAI
jgi:hypothetical protein